MKSARSARMRSILGASLIAAALPMNSAAESSDSNGGAISAGGGGAISAGGGGAISAGGGGAISAGGGGAISAGGVRAHISDGVIGTGFGAAITDVASETLLTGPVDSIDRVNGVFTSLGQVVMAPGTTLNSLSIGDVVSVDGQIASPGWINAAAISVSKELYIPGATEVSVTGIPKSVDWNRGRVTIGDGTFDYTPSLGGDGFEGIGAAITVIGTQPALGGTVISDRVLVRTELFLSD